MQKTKNYKISKIDKYTIDSKKEFNAAVDASLFKCSLDNKSNYICSEYNLYNLHYILDFGWVDKKFVSNISDYLKTQNIDNKCPIEWRQGLKHDCASIMELEKYNGHYKNKLNNEVAIENDLVYGFIKSSDLQNTLINQTRKYTIVTQHSIGQETIYIKKEFPKTYDYLVTNIEYFENRKSSIYKGKPAFSIFGIGDYSFQPFKVAISGLYKTYHFSLVLPQNSKPVMLDDTCYFIGFDNLEYAVYTLIILNSDITVEFLKAITFTDSKRMFTKEHLMRIDLYALTSLINIDYIDTKLSEINK